MDNARANWGAEEWRAHALMLEDEYRRALDGWRVTVAELEAHAGLLSRMRDDVSLMSVQIATLKVLLDAADKTKPITKRSRGRPSKINQGISDLDLFAQMKSEYLSNHPDSKPTDKKIVEWNFAQLFLRQGMRAGRVETKEVQSQIKTFRNRLSEARHPLLPKKSR